MMSAAFTGLDDPTVRATLDRLHAAAAGDRWVFVRAVPGAIGALLSGRSYMDGVLPYLKDAYIPIGPDEGRLMYLTARSRNAQQIVEFGPSNKIPRRRWIKIGRASCRERV